MQVQAGFFMRIRKDVFLEGVVAELGYEWKEKSVDMRHRGTRTEVKFVVKGKAAEMENDGESVLKTGEDRRIGGDSH